MLTENNANSSTNINTNNTPNEGIHAESNINLMSACNLLRYKIFNNNEEIMGNIKDIVFSLKNGRISYVILSFGSFLGMREKLMAIPLTALKFDYEKEYFTLNMAKSRLDNPLVFDNDNWPDMTSTVWSSKVYKLFGLDQKSGEAAL